MKTVRFNLLAPPSTNRIWRVTSSRVYKSKEYKNWIASETWKVIKAAMAQDITAPLIGPLMVGLIVHPSDGRNARRDLDNSIKPVLDLCEMAMLIDNDRDVTHLFAEKGAKMLTHHIEVTVKGHESGL